MGEIKSTLDLVMEKTAGLVPTKEEREGLARREREEKVRILARRLRDGELSAEEVDRELTRLEAQWGPGPWRSVLFETCARTLEPGPEALEVLEALEALGCPYASELAGAARQAMADWETLRREAAERVRRALEAEGIAGSAVVPNPDADPGLEEARRAVRHAFARRRDERVAAGGG
ncbi:MAG: hypothetical protein Kow0092_29970 [Deferrisomatales bacterium]